MLFNLMQHQNQEHPLKVSSERVRKISTTYKIVRSIESEAQQIVPDSGIARGFKELGFSGNLITVSHFAPTT